MESLVAVHSNDSDTRLCFKRLNRFAFPKIQRDIANRATMWILRTTRSAIVSLVKKTWSNGMAVVVPPFLRLDFRKRISKVGHSNDSDTVTSELGGPFQFNKSSARAGIVKGGFGTLVVSLLSLSSLCPSTGSHSTRVQYGIYEQISKVVYSNDSDVFFVNRFTCGKRMQGLLKQKNKQTKNAAVGKHKEGKTQRWSNGGLTVV